MTTTIIGLDFGSHSLKLIRLSMGREPRVLGYDIEPVARVAGPEVSEPGADPADFDDSPTAVHRRDAIAGDPDAGEPGESGESGEPGAADEGSADADANEDPNDWSDAQAAAQPWSAALQRLVERGAIDDDALVVTFLPDNQAMSIRQDLPFVERAKVENILPHMLNDRLPVATDRVIYDFQIFPRKKTKPGETPPEVGVEEAAAEALVGFARREHIGEFLAGLKPHGINPALLGVPELLMSYALQRCAPTPDGTYAVIDIGHRYTRVLVLNEFDPVVARSIQFGGEQLTEAIASRFKSSYEQAENLKETRAALLGGDQTSSDARSEARLALSECLSEALRPLIRDIRRTFQSLYNRNQTRIDGIYICGGTSLMSGLAQYLEQQFGVPVSHLPTDRLAGFSSAIEKPSDQLKLALAASAALQQIDGRDEDRAINLRRQEFTYRGKSSYLRSQLLKYGAAAALLFLLLMGMLLTQKLQLEAQRDAMRAALGEQTTKLFGEPVYNNSAIQARLSGEESSGKGFVPRASAYELYYLLASNIPADLQVSFSRFETDVDRNIAQLYGETTNPQSVERLIDNLRAIDCIQSVRQEGELRIKSDNEVEFHLHVSSECS